MKIHIVIKLLISMIVLQQIITTPTKQQLIWYISHTAGSSPNYNYFYHVGVKIDNNVNNLNALSVEEDLQSSFKVRVYRDDETNYGQETVQYLESDDSLNRFRYFLPDLNGGHRDNMPLVMWDIEMNCGCYITYKIKFFRCDTDAKNYYDALSDTNKRMRYSDYDETNQPDLYAIKGLPDGRFKTTDELKHIITNSPTCRKESGSSDNSECCYPYACWLDVSSPQCICALNKGTGAGFVNGYGEDCWCSFDDGDSNCSSFNA